MSEFLKRCFYQPGQYGSDEAFARLAERAAAAEAPAKKADRIFYLSIPPSVFVDAARAATRAASSLTGWTRVIVEKPFGRDSDSYRALASELGQHISEDATYRIDHYLGKELIENLTVLRFANLVFEPLWSRNYIRAVQVIFSEDFGTEGRGYVFVVFFYLFIFVSVLVWLREREKREKRLKRRKIKLTFFRFSLSLPLFPLSPSKPPQKLINRGYFDSYGIIRDVIQNHLLQILALFAMEPPASLDAEDIRDEKVKVLRSMRPVSIDDVVVGQYRGRAAAPGRPALPGYLDDDTVPKGSLCPTFAAAAMFINNARWDGVPFLLKAGKALSSRSAEIRVQFRHVPGNLYRSKLGLDLDRATNELVIRIQPDEAIYLKVNNKVPGLGLRLDVSRLDLSYKSRFGDAALPDAYERLILDVVNGDKRLFIRSDELEAAWGLFTPLLNELDSRKVQPELYPYGSRGPVGAHYLAAKYGVRWGDLADDAE